MAFGCSTTVQIMLNYECVRIANTCVDMTTAATHICTYLHIAAYMYADVHRPA